MQHRYVIKLTIETLALQRRLPLDGEVEVPLFDCINISRLLAVPARIKSAPKVGLWFGVLRYEMNSDSLDLPLCDLHLRLI